MMILIDDHFVLIIEIDKDKNSIVQLIDNNIVETNKYVENMLLLLFHQPIEMNAKNKKTNI